jgi:5-(aminomethyl)-3-furanmethanol phosphate kinase
MRRRSELWVVKIGGSVASGDALASWIGLFDRRQRPRVVIVPGGGAFADQVRIAQRDRRFDDSVAHRMALMAMDQMGLMFTALSPALRTATTRMAIAEAHRRGYVPVWLPTRMATGRKDIPETWEVTSDSLAAWLAGALTADRLVLVKSADPPDGPVTAAALCRYGLVDKAFSRFISGRSFECWCVGSSRYYDMTRALKTGSGPGSRILCHA